MPEKQKSIIKGNIYLAWKPRLFRMAAAGIGFLMGMGGMTPDITWGQMLAMMGPMAIGGLVLVLLASVSTSAKA